jgi:hypothetical protein
MSLESALRELHARLQKLHDTLSSLRLIVVDDQPAKGAVLLVDQFGYAADDLMGCIDEAVLTCVNACRAAGENPADIDIIKKSVAVCQDRYNRIARKLTADLAAHERIEDLLGFGRTARGEWVPWTTGVRDAIASCRQPVDDAGAALLDAWQELAERIGMNSVTVKATNIGQQIAVPANEFAPGGVP